MPARLHVDERQLAQDIGDHCRPVRGPGGQQRAVQHYRCLTIGSPHGVHQRAAQGALHLSLQSQVTGPAGLLNRAAQRFHPRVGRARVQGCGSRP